MTVHRYFRLKPVSRRQHFLFNLLNFLYFRKRDYRKGFSIESNPLFIFIVIPYIVFSEVYFFGQRRYFVTLEQQIVGVFAVEDRTEALYISSLAVSSFYRRIGVATYLLNYATALAGQLDMSVLDTLSHQGEHAGAEAVQEIRFQKEKGKYQLLHPEKRCLARSVVLWLNRQNGARA